MRSKNLWPPTVKRVVICIGAEKTATSFLHRCAEESENVCTSSVKEVHFFDKQLMYPNRKYVDRARKQLLSSVRNSFVSALSLKRPDLNKIKACYNLVSLRTGDKIEFGPYVNYMCGNYNSEDVIFEATPMYCLLDDAQLQNIGYTHPDTRILLSMRDPVNRAWSSVKYSLRRKVETGELSRDDVLDAFEKAVSDTSSFVYQQSHYLGLFEKLERAGLWEQTHVCFMESLSTDVEGSKMNECFGTDVNLRLDERVNVHSQHVAEEPVILEQAVDMFADTYSAVRARFGDRVPSSWRR